jgi:uridylate kinase
MLSNDKPLYRRILFKISGEVLQGDQGFGIDSEVLNRVAREIKDVVRFGVQVGLVIGGGNIFRGSSVSKSGINRIAGDQIGMLATVMNGLAIRDALQRTSVDCRLMSSISMPGFCDDYSTIEAIRFLKNGEVVIFSAGTGNPLFSTDSAACLRGIEIEADIVLKATKVDGVFSEDPMLNKKAKMYDQISYDHVLKHELEIMDLAAFMLAREHKLPIRVFNMKHRGSLRNIVLSNKGGTLIK